MAHATIGRFLLRRAIRTAAKEGIKRAVSIEQREAGRRRIKAEVGGVSVGLTTPRRTNGFDFGDIL